MKTTLTFSRETKGTKVYKNDADDAPIRSLYIDQDAFKDAKAKSPPKTITVEIKEL